MNKFIFAPILFVFFAGSAFGQFGPLCGISFLGEMFNAKEIHDSCAQISSEPKVQCQCISQKLKDTVWGNLEIKVAENKKQENIQKNREAQTEGLLKTFEMMTDLENYQRSRLGMSLRVNEKCNTQSLAATIKMTVDKDQSAQELIRKNPSANPIASITKIAANKSLTSSSDLEQSLGAYEKSHDRFNTEKKDLGCITRKEFFGMRSLPSQEALNQLMNWDGEIKSLANSDKEKETAELKKFLVSNPIITKLMASEKGRKFTVSHLKVFADANLGKSKSEVQASLTDLVKKDLAPYIEKLEKEENSPDMLACADIGRKLVAVQVIDDPTSEPNGFMRLVSMCESIKNMPEENIKATLESNALYQILSGVSKSGTSLDEQYEDFVKQNCGGFEEYRNNVLDERCKKKSSHECLSETEEERLRLSFLQQNRSNEILATVHDMDKLGIGGKFTKKDAEKFQNVVKKSKMSDKIRSAYENLMSKLSSTPIAAKTGSESLYFETQEQKMAEISAPNKSSSSSESYAANFDNSAENNNIVAPSWINENPSPMAAAETNFSSENLAKGSQAFLPKNFNALSPEDKIKAIDDVETNLNKITATKSEDVKALENQIQDMQEELDEAKKLAQKEIVEKPKNIASSGDSTIVNQGNVASTPAYVPFYGTGGSSGGMGSSPSFNSNSGAKSDLSRSESSRDKALLSSKYANSEAKEASRGIASVDGLVVVSNDAITSLPGNLGAAKVLTVSDSELDQFKGSAEALNKQLQGRMSELGLKAGENKLIEIKSKDSDKKMYLHAVWKDKTWVFHPFTRKVQSEIASRTVTLKSLTETLPLNQ